MAAIRCRRPGSRDCANSHRSSLGSFWVETDERAPGRASAKYGLELFDEPVERVGPASGAHDGLSIVVAPDDPGRTAREPAARSDVEALPEP